MLADGQPREQEVARIVAELCQRDGLNGFLPLVNLFCNVLTFPQPPPSSVFLTMPGSSRDLHLPLCFVNPCFPTWFCFNVQLIGPHPNKQEHKRTHTHTLTTLCKKKLCLQLKKKSTFFLRIISWSTKTSVIGHPVNKHIYVKLTQAGFKFCISKLFPIIILLK